MNNVKVTFNLQSGKSITMAREFDFPQQALDYTMDRGVEMDEDSVPGEEIISFTLEFTFKQESMIHQEVPDNTK